LPPEPGFAIGSKALEDARLKVEALSQAEAEEIARKARAEAMVERAPMSEDEAQARIFEAQIEGTKLETELKRLELEKARLGR